MSRSIEVIALSHMFVDSKTFCLEGFLHGFVESLSVILVSEIGDKTFFIAAILAMSNNKLTVGRQFELCPRFCFSSGFPRRHICLGGDDNPLRSSWLRRDHVHPEGVHLLHLHCHYVPLRGEGILERRNQELLNIFCRCCGKLGG